MSYGTPVLYPAPSVVTAQIIVPLASSSNAMLFGPMLNAFAPPSPFTLVTCICGAVFTVIP